MKTRQPTPEQKAAAAGLAFRVVNVFDISQTEEAAA
jgi:hypothetical protein